MHHSTDFSFPNILLSQPRILINKNLKKRRLIKLTQDYINPNFNPIKNKQHFKREEFNTPRVEFGGFPGAGFGAFPGTGFEAPFTLHPHTFLHPHFGGF